MIALCRVVKRHNAGYFTHLRDESNKVLEAVEEAIEIAEAMRRACRDRALQMLRHGQLGQGRAGAGDDRRRQGARARRRLRFLSLCGRQQSAQEPDAAMGAGRRRRRDAGAARRRGDARAHPRRHRPRRAQQLGPHPVMGLRADLDLAQPAATCRTHDRRARGRARARPDRHGRRLSGRRQGRDPRAGHLDLGGRHPRDRGVALGAGRLRRQLRRDLRHRQPGHAASALLRHLPAHHRPLRRRAGRAAARARHAQDDRRHRARAQARGSRLVAGRLSRRRDDLRSGRFPRSRHLCASRTNIRAATAPP